MTGACLRPTRTALHTLFHPRAIAVVGATDDPTKHGYIVLTNIRRAGFRGGVYGVSRRLAAVGDVPCVPDFKSLPEQVDVAFLAIPAEAATGAVRDAARAGLSAVIVGSAGYAESLDAGGAERQKELQRVAAEEGIRIVGPNCNGIYNAHGTEALGPVSIGFNTAHAKRQPSGGIAIFSHSGALFDAMAGRLAMLGAGLSLFASAGNEADLSVLDYLDYAIDHAPTRVIALLIDSLDDGQRFRDLARRARDAGKGIVALKLGASEAGAAAAVAHSSRLAGDAAAYAALFAASGVAQVSSLEGLMLAAALLQRHGPLSGALGAVSTSGAGASLIADRCTALNVPLAELAPATRSALDKRKMFSRIGNPLDLGIFGGMRRAGDVPSLLMNDPGVGIALGLVHSMNPWQGDPIRAALARGCQSSGKQLLILAPGGMPEEERATYEANGMPVFTETDILIEGIGALLTPPPLPVATGAVASVATFPDRALSEPESLALLQAYGVPVVATVACQSAEEAATAASAVGYPVVLKGIVDQVAHKTELGLVRLGLMDEAAVRGAYQDLGCQRVVVQPLVRGELEAIAGVSRSDGVGLVLVAGLGGIHAEALRDVATWPVPVARAAIEAGLGKTSLGRILASPRWAHPQVFGAMVDLLMELQATAQALDGRLQAIDVNPVVLGQFGACAVDALVVPRS